MAPLAPGLPGRWGLTTAAPATAGAAVAVSGQAGVGGGAAPDAGDAALLAQVAAALSAAWGRAIGPLGLTHRCPVCGGAGHGAPRLTGLPPGRTALVSISGVAAADGRWRVAAWWTPDAGGADRADSGLRAPRTHGAAGLGLDLEQADAPAFGTEDALGAVAFGPHERAWIRARPVEDRPAARARLWTRKEAIVKAAGTGFTGDPADVDALTPPSGTVLVDIQAAALRRAGTGRGVVGALALRPHSSGGRAEAAEA